MMYLVPTVQRNSVFAFNHCRWNSWRIKALGFIGWRRIINLSPHLSLWVVTWVFYGLLKQRLEILPFTNSVKTGFTGNWKDLCYIFSDMIAFFKINRLCLSSFSFKEKLSRKYRVPICHPLPPYQIPVSPIINILN